MSTDKEKFSIKDKVVLGSVFLGLILMIGYLTFGKDGLAEGKDTYGKVISVKRICAANKCINEVGVKLESGREIQISVSGSEEIKDGEYLAINRKCSAGVRFGLRCSFSYKYLGKY